MQFTACVKTLESGKTEVAARVALHGPEILCSKSRLFYSAWNVGDSCLLCSKNSEADVVEGGGRRPDYRERKREGREKKGGEEEKRGKTVIFREPESP